MQQQVKSQRLRRLHNFLGMPLCTTQSQKFLPVFCWDDCTNNSRIFGEIEECYTYDSGFGGCGQLCLESDDVELTIYKDGGSEECDDMDCVYIKKWTIGWMCACSCTFAYYTLAYGSNKFIRGCCSICFIFWFLFLIPFIILDIMVFFMIAVCLVPFVILMLICICK